MRDDWRYRTAWLQGLSLCYTSVKKEREHGGGKIVTATRVLCRAVKNYRNEAKGSISNFFASDTPQSILEYPVTTLLGVTCASTALQDTWI